MGSAPAIRANSRLDSGLGIGVRRRFPLGKRQKLPSAFPSCRDPGIQAGGLEGYGGFRKAVQREMGRYKAA